jgi:sphinganine-1-phosphate aldolase
VSTDWPGGIYLSPSVSGTRSGGTIAAAWTSLVALGENGFLHHTQRALEATRHLALGITEIPELEVMAKPDATLVAWRTRKSSELDVYTIADRLEDRDWSVDRQQNPPCIHCTVTSSHLPVIDDYLADVRQAVAFVLAHPELQSRGNAATYGMMAKVPFRGMVRKNALELLERLYGPDAADPELDPFADPERTTAMSRLAKHYGGRALGVLDRFEGVRRWIGWPGRRRRA